MSKKTNKGLLIAGVIGAVSAIAGTSAVAYKKYNKYKTKKAKNEFNLLKLSEEDFLREGLKQIDSMNAEIEALKGTIPTLIENIENELAIEQPNKFAKSIQSFKDNQKVNSLEVIVPLEVDNMRLDRLADDLESLKKDLEYLYKKILKSYVSGNVLELENEKLFESVEYELADLGKEISSKLIDKEKTELIEE